MPAMYVWISGSSAFDSCFLTYPHHSLGHWGLPVTGLLIRRVMILLLHREPSY
jgi:hypothetical protein